MRSDVPTADADRGLRATLSFLALLVVTGLLGLTGCGGGSGGGGGGGGGGGVAIEGALGLPGGAGSTPVGAGPVISAGISGALIEALDADGNVIAVATTDADGAYTIVVPEGSYQIGVRAGTLDYFIPERQAVMVQGTSVQGLSSRAGSSVLDFFVPEPTGTDLTGQVQNNASTAITLEVFDPESGLVVYRTQTAADGTYTIAGVLPEGNYLLRVDAASIPAGAAVPTPRRLSITSGAADLIVDPALAGATETTGLISSAVGVAPLAGVSPGGALQPAFIPQVPLIVSEGAEVVVFERGYGEIARFPIESDGSYRLDLRDGSYRLEFVGLSQDSIPPAPLRITVKNGEIFTEGSDDPLDAASESIASTAHEVSATLTGSVTFGGNGVITQVVAIDPVSGGTKATATTTSSGSYSLALADGSYDVILRKELLPPGLQAPAAMRVAVEAGDDPAAPFRETQGTANDGVVDFELAAAPASLTGTVTTDLGAPLGSVRIRARQGSEVVARSTSDATGAYSLNLPLGTFDIDLNPATVPSVFVAPARVRIEVAPTGGSPVITDATGVITELDFVLVDAPAPNVAGTVSYDFNNDTVIDTDPSDGSHEFVGCTVQVFGSTGTQLLAEEPTDPTTGAYQLILSDGTYVLGLDPETLPPGTAPPPRMRLSVSAAGITLESGDQYLAADGDLPAPLDFQLLRRASTLQGMVTINARGTSVGLLLVDASGGEVVNRVSSEPVSGAFRLPMFSGSYELVIDRSTLPSGTAIPDAVPLSVAADGTISSTTGTVLTLDLALTRSVATLTGMVTVTRQAQVEPLAVVVQSRDPQTRAVLQQVFTDPATGAYSLLLLPGSREIAIATESLPPGVQAPAPVVVTIEGTSISGPGVTAGALDFDLFDLRNSGVDLQGTVFDSTTGAGLAVELRIFDPTSGSVTQNFLQSILTNSSGQFSFRAVDGTYALAVLPSSLPPTALAPASVTFAVQGASIIESNTRLILGAGVNAADDGIVNFSVRDGATAGIRVVGAVTSMGSPVVGARVRLRDSATDTVVAEQVVNPVTGGYSMQIPLGNYLLRVSPSSLPFSLLPPSARSVLASSNLGITTVTTNGGAVVTPAVDGSYVFDFTPQTASQVLQGTTLNPSGSPLRMFVRILDSQSGAEVATRWSSEADGTFLVNLAPGAYQVVLGAGSLPFGTVAPAPVSVTVTASAVLESNGTADDGSITLQLQTANRTISGIVLNNVGTPMGCFVRVENSQTGAFIAGTPTSPASGAYSLVVAPGSYRVKVDPPSLPPGNTAPSSQTVDVLATDATADFTVQIASQCVSGTVLTATTEVALPAFVRLVDASTQQFIAGTPTEADGGYELCVAPGSYQLKIDSNSLPPGTITPSPVTVQITASTILENDTTGAGNAANDGVVNFRVSEETADDLAQLSGTVTLTQGGSSQPLGAFVLLRTADSGSVINGVFSDPGAGGAYTLTVPAGSYEVLLDPATLPPGLALPTPRQISVAADDTITVQINGVPVVTDTLDFVLQQSSNPLSGQVLLGANGFACYVELVDPTNTQLVLLSQPTAADGSYNLLIPNGTSRIRVAPFSLPPGILAPGGVNVTAQSGIIIESSGSANDGIVNFTLSQAGATLSGYVVDDQNNDLANDVDHRMYAFVKVIETSSGQVVAQSPTGPGSYYTMPLLDGTYDVVVDPPSLPLDVVPPLPSRITVSGAVIALTSAGDGQFDAGARLRITATRLAQAATVAVLVEDGDGNFVPADVRVRDAFGNTLFSFFVPPTGLGTEVLLGNGSYTLRVVGASVPAGFSVPDATPVVVSAGVPDPASVTIVLTASTLTGTITNAFTAGGAQLVDLQLLDGNEVPINPDVALAQNGMHGTYELPLGDGSYILRLQRAPGVSANEVLLPARKAVSVAGGVIQNVDDDPTLAGIQVNFTVPPIAGMVAGTATVDAAPLPNLLIRLINPVNNRVVNEIETTGDGSYTLAAPAGYFVLRPSAADLGVEAPTALAPSPYAVEVSAAGNVIVMASGIDLCGGSTGPDELCADLDFAMNSFQLGVNGRIEGTVQALQNPAASPQPISGATVYLLDANLVPVGSAVTDGSGEYALLGVDGIYQVVVDLAGIQLGFPVLPEPPVTVSLSGSAVTESNTVGSGNLANDGIVSFTLDGASALVTGRVQTAAGSGVGALLVVTPSSATSIPDGFNYELPTQPDGQFFLPVGPGNFKLWVHPEFLPPGFLAPAPTTFAVSGSSITESSTAGTGNLVNDGIIHPVVASNGVVVWARVLNGADDPVPAFLGLYQTPANPTDPPFFLAGLPSDPLTGNVTLTATTGSYFLEVAPYSLPPGVQPPSRVYFSVASSTVSWAAGTETVAIDGNTAAVIRVSTANTEVRGYARDGADLAASQPVATIVIALDAATGGFVRDAITDPTTGSYFMALADGTYDLIIDRFTLPPGYVPPAGVRVSISGATVTEANSAGVDPADGVSANVANDGVVNFVVNSPATTSTLHGIVRDADGNPSYGVVRLMGPDSSGGYSVLLISQPVDFLTGEFQMPVPNGSYQVRLDPGSVPQGLSAPQPVLITAASGTIAIPAEVTEDAGGLTRLVLALSETTGGVSGSVLDGMGGPIQVHVVAEDLNSGLYMGGSATDAAGDYAIALPPGSFRILLEPFSLPLGTVPPAPRTVTVTAGAFTTADFTVEIAGTTFTGNVLLAGPNHVAGVTTIDCSAIAMHVAAGEVLPVPCGVALYVPSSDGVAPPTLLTQTYADPVTGFFSLPLGGGTYSLVLASSSLPSGVSPPPPLTLVVSGGSVTITGSTESCSNAPEQRIILLEAAALTLNGTVQDPAGAPVGAFLELKEAGTGHFVAGAQSNPADGNFSLPIGDLNYELRVTSSSVPAGLIPPAPVSIASSGGTLLVGNVPGVTWDGNLLTIALGQASAVVSGTVRDTSQNPLAVQVRAFDSAGQLIQSTWSHHATGSYSMALTPGVYTVRVANSSLPAGYAPPAAQSVNLLVQNTATADFTISPAPASITGRVSYTSGDDEIGVPAFVRITDAATGALVTGVHAAPVGADFVYSLNVAAGSYRIGLDPGSLPAGYVVPAPVDFTVSINSVSGTVTISEASHGVDDDLTDGVIDFELLQAGVTLAGQVVYDTGGGSFVGLPAFVRVELAGGTGVEVAATATAASGNFTLSFGDGTFLLAVDPASLPPGFVPAPPETVVVNGSNLTIDGQVPADPYLLVVYEVGAQVTGLVTESTGTPVPGAFVTVMEAAGGSFVGGASTDGNGAYAIALADGSYLVAVDPFSVPPGLVAPAPTSITVSGADVTVDIVLDSPAATVTVQVQDGQGNLQFVPVRVRDASTNVILTEQFHAGAPVAFALPAGSYYVTIPSSALPPGFSPPPPVDLLVNGDGTTQDGSGSPGDSFIVLTIQQAAATIAGTVTFEGSAAPGVQVVARDAASLIELASTHTGTLGQFALNLPVGDYLVVPAAGLPVGVVPPAPRLVRVFGPGSIDPDGSIDFGLVAATGAASGQLTLDGIGVPGAVAAFQQIGAEWLQVAVVPSSSDGTYTLPLTDDTFVLVPRISVQQLASPPELLIQPQPATVDGSQTTNGVDFAFFTPGAAGAPIAQVLFGDVTAGGVLYDAPVLVATASGLPMELVATEQGSYRVAIQAGDYFVGLLPGALPAGFEAPAPVAIEIDAGAITGPGVVAENSEFRLDLSIEIDGAILHGAVTDWDGNPLPGVEVAAEFFDGTPGPLALTGSSGEYALILSEGEFDVTLRAGLPADAVRPPPMEVAVTSSGGTLELSIDGQLSGDGRLDWDLSEGVTQLSGVVLAGGAPASAEIIVLDAGGDEVTFGFSSSGPYAVALPLGTFTIYALLDGPQYGVLIPTPLVLDVDGSQASVVHDFLFPFADGTTPGGTLLGQVSSDGQPYETDLVLLDAAGDFYTEFATDMGGSFSLTLPPGDFVLEVPGDELPAGYPAASYAIQFVMTADGPAGPGIDGGSLYIALNTQGTLVSGTIADATGAGVPGVAVRFGPYDPGSSTSGTGDGWAFSATDGSYALLLEPGDYEAEIDAASVPAGLVKPPLVDLTVADSDLLVDFVLLSAAATVSGIVQVDGQGSSAEIIAFDAAGAEVSSAATDASGTYVLPLPAGDVVLIAELEDSFLVLVVPDPRLLTITAGNDLTGIDFEFSSPTAGNSTQLTGQVLLGGFPVEAELELLKYLAGSLVPFSELTARYNGADIGFQAHLTPGDYRLVLVEVNGQPFAGSSPIELGVVSGAITVDGQLLAGNHLEILLPGGVLEGQVRGPSGTPGSFLGVELVRAEHLQYALPGIFVPTDHDGLFQAGGFQDGAYWLALDPVQLPPGHAQARLPIIHVSSGGIDVFPQHVDVSLVPSAGTLSGMVTVDGLMTEATVYVLDRALQLVAYQQTSAGTYALELPSGSYRVVAQLTGTAGLASPAAAGSVDFQGDATLDLATSTSQAATLTGRFTIDGEPQDTPLIVTTDTDPPLVQAIVAVDGFDGSYGVLLPAGDYEVLPWPQLLGPQQPVSRVAISSDGSAITGEDADGQPIVGNLLDVEPFGNSSSGDVRRLAREVLTTLAHADLTTLGGLLDPDLLWAGRDAATLLSQLPLDDEHWGVSGRRFDGVVCELLEVDPNTTLVTLLELRERWLTGLGAGRESHAFSTFSDDPTLVLEFRRTGLGDPWRFAGDGLHIDGAAIEHRHTRRAAGGTSTDSEDVTFHVGQNAAAPLSGVSVTGPGLTSGTLGLDGDEWIGTLSVGGASPLGFAGTLDDLVDGADYEFTATTVAGPQDIVTLRHHEGIAGLYPTVSVTLADNGNLLVVWSSIAARLNSPLAEICLDLTADDQGQTQELLDECGLPAASGFLELDSALLNPGPTYEACVTFEAASGARQVYCLQFDWPLVSQEASLQGVVSDPNGPVAGVEVMVHDEVTQAFVVSTLTSVGGDYLLTLPVGNYIIELASLPQGVTPPASVFASITDNLGLLEIHFDGVFSPDGTLDWFLSGSGGGPTTNIQGVVSDPNGPVAGVEVMVHDEVTQAFIVSTLTSAGGDYLLALPVGNYIIELASLPQGVTPPASVFASITDNLGLLEIHFDGVLSPDGTLDWFLSGSGGGPMLSITGTVTGPGGPLAGVEVHAYEAGTQNPIGSSPTDGAGTYSLPLGPGMYVLSLENLPAGTVPPPEVDVQIIDDAGALEAFIDGSSSPTAVLDWDVQTAVAELSGSLSVDGAPGTGNLLVFDGLQLIAETQSTNGMYTIGLPEGDLTVIAELDSFQPGLLVPAPYIVTILDTGMPQQLMHDFEFVFPDPGSPGYTLYGSVISNGLPFETPIHVENDTGHVVALLDTDTGGGWQVGLPVGNYDVSVAPSSLPGGFVGVSRVSIEVTVSGIEGPGVNLSDQGDHFLVFQLNTQGTLLSGHVRDPALQGVEGVLILIDPLDGGSGAGGGFPQSAFAVTNATGLYELRIEAGDYELELDPATLPAGVVTPPITETPISGPTQTLDFDLIAADASVSGRVTINGVATPDAEVIAFTPNGDEASFAFVNALGEYTLPLVSGSYVLIASLEDANLGMLVTPDPLAVAIVTTDFVNTDFDFVSVTGGNAEVLTGSIVQNGTTVSAELSVRKLIGGNLLSYAHVETEYDDVAQEHAFVIALSNGSYELEVTWADGVSAPLSPIDLTVGGGEIQVSGQALPQNELVITVPGTVSGIAVFDGAVVAGLEVQASPRSGGPNITTTTGADGVFLLTGLSDGDYWVSCAVTGLPPGAGVVRSLDLFVESQGYAPESMLLTLPTADATLEGVVRVDGAPLQARVFILDQNLRTVYSLETDAQGAYSVPLAAGRYSLLAVPGTPVAAPHPQLAPVLANGTVVTDIDFDTTTPTTSLTGTIARAGVPADTPLLISAAGGGGAAALAFPEAGTGMYSVPLPDGDYEALLWPERLPLGVSSNPVALSVTAGAITGTDLDGDPVTGNVLDLDPYTATEISAVRQVTADFLLALASGDEPALQALLAPGTLFDGLDKAAWILEQASGSSWGRFGSRTDEVVASFSLLGPDAYQVSVRSGREFSLEDDGSAREERWQADPAGNAQFTLQVVRASALDPWQIAGNGLAVSEAWIEHRTELTNDGMGQTTRNEIEFGLEAGLDAIFTATANGPGITSGDLEAVPGSSGGEWRGLLNSGGPLAGSFQGTYADIVDDELYAFSATFASAPTAQLEVRHHVPVASLYPVIEVHDLGSGGVLVSWAAIVDRLGRPLAYVDLEITLDDQGNLFTIHEAEGLPAGQHGALLEAGQFQPGATYRFTVEVQDTGSAVHAYVLIVDWPTGP